MPDGIDKNYENVPLDHTFEIPSVVAKCPYCDSKLFAQCLSWIESDDGDGWIVEQMQVDCESEPDPDTNEWDEWTAIHSDMPYVYQLAVENKIEKWINQNFRFVNG